jgi:hypothetical protein
MHVCNARVAKTPNLVFRLPLAERAQLDMMAKLYGSPSVSAFLREMVGAMCSGDDSRASAFNVRLMEKATGQMALALQVEAQRKASIESKPSIESKQGKTRKTRKQSKQSKPRKTHRTLKPHRTHERTT